MADSNRFYRDLQGCWEKKTQTFIGEIRQIGANALKGIGPAFNESMRLQEAYDTKYGGEQNE